MVWMWAVRFMVLVNQFGFINAPLAEEPSAGGLGGKMVVVDWGIAPTHYVLALEVGF